MAIEQALVFIKPDGIKKSLTGNVLTKLSEAGLTIIGAKAVKVTTELCEAHYFHLKEKPFFPSLMEYIKGKMYGDNYDRVLAFVYQGENATEKLRKIAGATNPEQAEATSIRGSYGRITTTGVFENVVHCSENASEAEREIKLWFKPEELTTEIYPTKKAKCEKEEVTVWA